MDNKDLKELKDKLWHSADLLRSGAHLAANKYGQPILGLIFLRYADILFKQHKIEIDNEYNEKKGTRNERSYKEVCISKIGFFLPECAYFDSINNSPDTAAKAVLVKKAMEQIEIENEFLKGVFPKEVYGQLVPQEEPELLSRIIRIFKNIPENINIDLFGEIYEYFLGNFAINEGKDGGTFYTPATVVRYMVEVIKPEAGEKMFLDPACGSGGMFVQAARYMHTHNKNADRMKFRCYGVEKEPDTVKLAKMNLILNNVRGEITEANSFYSNPYDAVGKFDYVMANPPFNVDEVLYERVKDDPRFNEYGLPKNKTKKGKEDAKETVPNANYLWISYFATSLNQNGRGAFVMANSASDAGGNEEEIRKNLIESGIIKQMVLLPSNMFTSVTLPATLWFLDKNVTPSKKREVLFIDARNIFTQVDRGHRKFSEEQIKNLSIISRLYEGDSNSFFELLDFYSNQKNNSTDKEYWQKQIDWLNEKFPEGKYRDNIGLCKVASIEGEDGIADQEYSLNAARYVGVSFDSKTTSYDDFKNKNTLVINDVLQLMEKLKSVLINFYENSNNLLSSELIENGWHIGKVSELGEFKRGKNITSNEMIPGNIKVISAGIDPSGYHNVSNVSGPSITISASGANAGFISFHSDDIWAADCSYNNNSKYIHYLYEVLHYMQPIITNLQRGAAQPHVYAKDLNRLKIVIPPKEILERINDLLSGYHEQVYFLESIKNKFNVQLENLMGRILTEKKI